MTLLLQVAGPRSSSKVGVPYLENKKALLVCAGPQEEPRHNTEAEAVPLLQRNA